MPDDRILKSEEKAVFGLRALFGRYGYLSYSMSKFEEYELYIRNKDFLVSDRIITFIDTNGKLLALKPDVTLSIIKSGEDIPGCKQKVCYNENIYRVSGSTRRYKEIMQAGLECIGDIDLYDIYEVISLAAQGLALISESFVLEISHLGLLTEILRGVSSDEVFISEAVRFISEKNMHDLHRLCAANAVPDGDERRLSALVSTYGERKSVLRELRSICGCEALDELAALSDMLDGSPYSRNIIFDFSVVNDMNYYNGFVFKGFLAGVCDGVLAGGQYDKMMAKMNRRSGAIGFALYLDLLEQLETDRPGYDVDVLLLYDGSAAGSAVAERVNSLVASGLSVSAQKAVPPKLRYRRLDDMRKENPEC